MRDRSVTLKKTIAHLVTLNRPIVIVETGSMRADHGLLSFGDDGCSTLIWDLLVEKLGGKIYSMDLSINNNIFVNSFTKNVEAICGDSTEILKKELFDQNVDLFYLDSFDFDMKNPEASQLHHLNEFLLIEKRLNETILLIDDADTLNDKRYIGKATKVYEYLLEKGYKPTLKSYQIMWIF